MTDTKIGTNGNAHVWASTPELTAETRVKESYLSAEHRMYDFIQMTRQQDQEQTT